MTEVEQRLSALSRILPRRVTKGNGGVRPGVSADPKKDDNRLFPKAERTELEERMQVAMAVQIGVIAVMNTHQYSFNGKTFLQKAGGPIGLRATCAIARVVMNTWDTRWLEKMESNGIKIKTGVRYMDDIRIFLYALRAGWRWWEGSLCYCEVWRLEDESTGTSSTIRTARILVEIMNSMMSFLNFTVEVGDDFEDGKLPTLDLKIWVQAGVVEYEFYEKPMSGNTVVHAKTALSEQVKFSSLTQEVVRRLLHTSRRLPDDVMLECLEKLCQKMANSEHRPVYIKKVMISGITIYEAKLKKSLLPAGNPGFKPLHLGTF